MLTIARPTLGSIYVPPNFLDAKSVNVTKKAAMILLKEHSQIRDNQKKQFEIIVSTCSTTVTAK